MPAIKTERLADKPRRVRSSIARGFSGSRGGDAAAPIDRTGGDYGAGIIRGFAVVTRGEASGHNLWLDSHFIGQVQAAMAATNGIRVRFTHPSMSSDGIGRKLGRAAFDERDGDTVRGDLHFSRSSHSTPEGDLADYVLGLAEEDPELFGASIVFDRDVDAEWAFAVAHGAEIKKDEYGEWLDLENFESPDPDNVENYMHVRLAELRAVDVVDEPAANPGGMFSATPIPAEADSLAEYILGLSNETPACNALAGIDADRLRGFASRFLNRRGLSVAQTKEANTMPKTKLSEAAEEKPAETETPEHESPETDPEEAPEPEAKGEEKPTETDGDDPEKTVADKFARYVQAFGAENGPKWFGEKLSFEECLGRQNVLLSEKVKELETKLKAALAASGESDPVTTVPEGGKGATKEFNGLSENEARFAAGVKIPGK